MLARIVNKLRRIKGHRNLIKHHTKNLSNNADFTIDNALKGFAPRGSIDISDAQLGRIISAYQKAKERQKSVASEYLVSNEWLPIYENNLGAAMKLLLTGDVAGLRSIYQNFFRDPVSTGLHGMPVDMDKTYFSRRPRTNALRAYLIDALYRYEHWKTVSGGAPADQLVRPDIGNPYGISVDGRFITPGAEYQHYYAGRLLQLTGAGPSPDPTILELGGGYGGVAYFLHRADAGVRYVGIDLPEALALASFYLMAAFPDARFVLFGESGGDNFPAAFDFLMWPNFMIDTIPVQSVDVVFNSYSLAEMSPEAIGAYVREFGRIAPRHLLHVNHVKNAVLGADSFDLESVGFLLKKREKALWNMGRNLSMDEFEFVYQHRGNG